VPTPARTLADCLADAALAGGEGLRLLGRDGSAEWLEWSDVRDRALRVSAGLQASGVRRGEMVPLVFPTGAAFFDAFFGVMLAGAVPVPVYPPMRFGRLADYDGRTARMFGAVGARLVLADARVRSALAGAIRLARPSRGCLVLDDLPAASPSPVDLEPGDLALVQFSSGTTKEPKGVALSHRAVVAQAAILNAFWPDTADVRHSGVSWLPLYHDMGLIGGVFTALQRPGTLTLIPPEVFVARPSSWLNAISTYRATVSPAPNFAYALCVQRVHDEDLVGVDLSCWRVALNGSETVVPDVMRAFAERFAAWGFKPEALTPVYGLSEASLAVTFSDIARPFVARRFDRAALADDRTAVESVDGREIVSVGRPVPGVEIRITGPEGVSLGDGDVGLVECRGPSTMEGYVDRPDLTAQALCDGWLNTGDLGFTWRGELFLTGRAKDMLLLRGRNYAPDEVEQAVDSVPGVRAGSAVAVSWLPDGGEGEVLLVLVEARREVPADGHAALARACADRIVAQTGLAPERVEVVGPGSLPRTSSGKLQRQRALQEYVDGRLAGGPSNGDGRGADAALGMQT
jgi:fatty-acyl-CoA synthase